MKSFYIDSKDEKRHKWFPKEDKAITQNELQGCLTCTMDTNFNQYCCINHSGKGL